MLGWGIGTHAIQHAMTTMRRLFLISALEFILFSEPLIAIQLAAATATSLFFPSKVETADRNSTCDGDGNNGNNSFDGNSNDDSEFGASGSVCFFPSSRPSVGSLFYLPYPSRQAY